MGKTVTVIFIIILYSYVNAQIRSAEIIHQEAWQKAATNSQFDNYYKYSIYSTRSLAVKHPEIYLQADSVWMEALTTVYGGWQAEYEVRDRKDEFYWDSCGKIIYYAFAQETKKDGSEFQWSKMKWTNHRQNALDNKNLYPPEAPYLNWYDLRLNLLWNGIKGENWKTPFLTIAEALYFQQRSVGQKVYLLISDSSKGYVADANQIIDPLTGIAITKSQIKGNIVLVMNNINVWYPLMSRDDRVKDNLLSSIVTRYCSEGQVPPLSNFETNYLNDLLIGTEFTNDMDSRWALLVSSKFGKQWSWQSSVVRKLCTNLFTSDYTQPSAGDNSYALSTLNMVWAEMGNRLSPFSALMAETIYQLKESGPVVALLSAGNIYKQQFKRKDKNNAYVFGEYYRIWLPMLEDKLISGIGDCFVEACNTGGALTIADIPKWNVWVTNWWEKSGGGHVISGVYDENYNGAVLSNGVIDQGYNGPLGTLAGRFSYTICYNTKIGFLNSAASGWERPYKAPFTNLDWANVKYLVDLIDNNELGASLFATGRNFDSVIKTGKVYSAYIDSVRDEWKVFDLGVPIKNGALVNGKITDNLGLPIKDATVSLYDLNDNLVKGSGTDPFGNFSIKNITPGKYKVKIEANYSVKEYVTKWYNNSLFLDLNENSSVTINDKLESGQPPTVKIISPKRNEKTSSSYSIKINSSDDVHLEKVELYLDTTKVASFSSTSYTYQLETSAYTNGKYFLKAIAFDAKNQWSVDTLSFNIFNDLPPKIYIQFPLSGETLNSNFTVSANITDDVGLKNVKLIIDGRTIEEKTNSPFNFNINYASYTIGSHVIEILAEDLSGQKSINQVLVNFGNKSYNSTYNPVYSWGMNPPAGKFNMALDLAVGPDGKVYVVDSQNRRVQIFDQYGNYISSFLTIGQPFGLTVTKNGFVYVAAAGVEKYTLNGSLLNRWGVDGNKPGEFKSAQDIAVDSKGFVYVTDSNGNLGCDVCDKSNDRIQKFDSDGKFIQMWGITGSGSGQFNSPRGICIDKNDIIYVVDTYNQRIQKFDTEGNYKGEWKLKDNVYTGSPRIWGIDSDDEGNIYLADSDNGRVDKFKSDGKLLDSWNQWWAQSGIPWTQGVAVGQNGLVYVSDDIGNRIIALTKSGEFQFQFGGSMGDINGQMRNPNGIAIDKNGFVYISDYNNQQIQKFTKDGKFVKRWGGISFMEKNGKFGLVFGITIDKKGFIYTTDFETRGAPGDHPHWARVQKFTLDGEFVTKWGELGIGDNKFFWPTGITTDKNCNVYVVDAINNNVQVFSEDGRFIKRWGKAGSLDGELNSPRAIVLDDEGFIYISDGYGSTPVKARVQKFTNDGVFVKNWYLPESPRSMMPGMFGMVFDRYGFLYVADTHNQEGVDLIRQYSKDGVLISSFGKFLYNFWGISGDPSGLAISPDNLLYVTEVSWYVNKVSAFTLPYSQAGLVDVKEEKEIPDEFSLFQNYPNPFNPNTVIKYQLSTESLVTLKIYDVLGREVETLVNEIKQGGKYEVRFDGSNRASGVYFYRIEAAPLSGKVKGFVQTKKFILLK